MVRRESRGYGLALEAPPPARRRRWPWLVALACAAVVAVLIAWILRSRDDAARARRDAARARAEVVALKTDLRDASESARLHFDQAQAAYAGRRYADAARESLAAYALKPMPELLYNAAAAFWGNLIESDIAINIEGQVNPLTCTTGGAVLASAGALTVLRDFPNEDFAASWYAMALANKLTGADNDAGNDLAFRANTSVINGPTAGCPFKFYLGLDGLTPPTEIDLFTTMLHEIGHGLGFANFVNEASGANLASFTDVYSQYTRDNTLGQTWAQINPTTGNNAAIVASALRCNQISWSGANVTAEVPNRLQLGLPTVTVASGPAAGAYPVGTAGAIGSPLANPGVTGIVVQAIDIDTDGGGADTTLDGCSPFTNAASILGNIAIMDRGFCGFAVKYLNAITAGATAVIIADNAAGCPPAGLGGAQAGAAPIVRVTLPDGALIKANLPLTATVGLNPAVRAGSDPANRALLAALDPVATGSSISHFDASHLPNSLMEPAINADLAPEVNDVDLTFELFQDIGWFKADRSLVAADSVDPVQYGAAFNYVVTATNGGSGSDKPFALTITPPAGFAVGAATGTGWTCAGTAPVSCTRNAVVGPDLATGVQPAITLALFQMTLIMRLVRAEMLEVLRTDYIKFARARGLTDRAVHFGHALRNTLVPVITITGLQLGSLIAFAIITETVFQWPGMGFLFIQAVQFADVPVMAAYLCLIALIFVVVNLVVDLLYFAVDPRLRLEQPGGGH